MSGEEGIAALLSPERLWSRGECLARECPMPRTAGVYAWFFRVVPPGVPAEDCHQALGATLLYAGISPRQPAALIGSVSLPLDLQHNKRHPFHARLSVLRREARVRVLG